MIISGYAWGHIVASGPWQLGRDIRVIDTHPRPLVFGAKAFDGFSGAVLAATAVARSRVSVVALMWSPVLSFPPEITHRVSKGSR